MSLFPYLFIGVGGTGGKTVGMIHHHLKQSLKRAGLGELPLGWQFLHIDVPAKVDSRSPSLFYALPAASYVPLSTTQTTYVGLDSAISKTLGTQGVARHLAWESWRPFPPTGVSVQPAIGAGQYRTVGRVAAQASLDKIANAIERALTLVRDPAVQGEFDRIERALGRTPSPELPTPKVLVVGSVAGGSGSGMLLDVCDVVRGVGDAALLPDAVLFTPEVFQRGDGSMDPGVAPNTYLALCELANAMWTVTSQHPTVGRDRLFERAGVERPSPAQRGGPRSVYLVGRSGESVSLADADEVYAVVGRSFAEVAIDPSLSNALDAYGAANAAARATGTPDLLNLSTRQSTDLGSFGALGFGRVTLGREFFERYAAERLMRMVSLRLLDQHLTRHYTGDGKTDDQVLAEAVREAWPGFLAATGLSEVGPQNNDILQALSPLTALGGELGTFEAKVASECRAGATKGWVSVVDARAEASSAITRHFALDDKKSMRSAADTLVRRTLEDWARTAANSLRTAVVESVAEYGLPVTQRLLERLADDLSQAANEVGGKELAAKRETATLMLESVRTGKPGEERRVKADDAWVTQLGSHARQTLAATVDAWTLEFVARVLTDLRDNLVAPWKLAIEDADATLRSQVRPSQGIKPLDVWPRAQGVPSHLRPSRVEYLLDDLDAFPDGFVQFVGRSAGDGVDVSGGEGLHAAVEEAVKQVIAARRLRRQDEDAAAIRPATYLSWWVPRDGTGRRPAARAQVKVAFRVADLERRVFGWLHDDTKEVGRHLDETWTDHLAGPNLPTSEKDRRHARLVEQFGAALKVAHPLVKLDADLVKEIHIFTVDNAPLSLMISDLNVPDSEAALQGRLLDAAALEYGPLAQVRFTTTPASHATVFSTYATPYHAVEVRSIMQPVTSQHAALSEMVDFWLLRRSRPLTEWVPLGPDATQALVTGWFVGRALGRARVAGQFPPRHEVFIEAHNATPGRWVTLRDRAVRKATSLNQVGILLELLALTFLDCSQSGSLEPLAPFQELIRLGASVGSQTGPDPVALWVDSGDGVVDAASSYFPADPGSPEARSEALRGRCERLARDYGKYVTAERLADVAGSQESLMPEVFDLFNQALQAISRAAIPSVEDIDQ